MAYRNGIYVAFNGCGTAVPTESDIRYYNLLKAWHEKKNIDFEFINSHEKTCQVRDDSLPETLRNRLTERLANSKLLFLIVTDNTKNSSNILDFEITSAIDKRKIPVVAAYTSEEVLNSVTQSMLGKLPKVLQGKINKNEAKVLFIPFKIEPVKTAFSVFGVNEVECCQKSLYILNNEKLIDLHPYNMALKFISDRMFNKNMTI